MRPTDILAWLGLGGFYLYVIHEHLWRGATTLAIVGPYDTRPQGRGPLWVTQDTCLHQATKFHWRSPAQALAPGLMGKAAACIAEMGAVLTEGLEDLPHRPYITHERRNPDEHVR